jgi:hypothetical protein
MKRRGDDNLTSPSFQPQGVLVESAEQDDAGHRLAETSQVAEQRPIPQLHSRIDPGRLLSE